MIRVTHLVAAALVATSSPGAAAFDSGSTGIDGDLVASGDTTYPLPPDGVVNLRSLVVPPGSTLRFLRNLANTPAYVLVQDSAFIDGVIDVSGVGGSQFGVSPPGGYDGGRARGAGEPGGTGQGLGGSPGGMSDTLVCGGAGASFALPGAAGVCTGPPPFPVEVGGTYGASTLVPLVGGSGGGAGPLAPGFPGGGGLGLNGGGGGGALLLAVSNVLALNGAVVAQGGDGGSGEPGAAGGGGGSGGAVRLVATRFEGSGAINVAGGAGGRETVFVEGGDGSPGRARIEAEVLQFAGFSVPPGAVSVGAARPLMLATLPEIRIVTIDGVPVPAQPTGDNDVLLPATIINPVRVEVETRRVPSGTFVELLVTPATGPAFTSISTPLAGGPDFASASLEVDLPEGESVLTATVSFAASAATSAALAPYVGGEAVARLEASAVPGQPSRTRAITRSGRAVTLPLAMAGF